jgi:AcrR family transcriptional regulator
MPKLSKAQIEKNKHSIEKAALRCFLKHGYSGVSVRDIADFAGVSLGNLYNYYPDKMSLFESVLNRLSQEFLSPDNPIYVYTANANFPNDIGDLAEAVSDCVERYGPYFKMTYVDVVEFDGAHVGKTFSNVYEKFSGPMAHSFKKTGKLGAKKNIDPGFAFLMTYMQFYYFFALRKLFKAKNIFGEIPDTEVVKKMSEIFLEGLK